MWNNNFLTTYFNTASQLRIDTLLAGKTLDWHGDHPRPRVFIPLHKNEARFIIKDANIFVISHKDGMKDKFINVLKFEKVKGFSRMV